MRDKTVQSVSRAIELLNLIANHPQGVGVTDLARLSELHKSTVSRLVTTLETAGALERTPHRSDVKIAPAFAQRFLPQNTPNTLMHVARPFLQELSLLTNEATGLALPDGDQALFVDQISPNTTIQVRDWTGSRFPLHTVSAGKLFLAFRSPAEQERYLTHPLAAYTPNTMTDPARLRQSLAEIRETAVSWIFDEFSDGLSAVATPIRNSKGDIVAALTMYGPSYRFPNSQQIAHINQLMIKSAQRCSEQINAILET